MFMPVHSEKKSLFGLLASVVLSMFGKSPAKQDVDALRQMEFKTSTQRLGVRFTEKIRNIFRFKWLRKF
jgi:hypothetical protein